MYAEDILELKNWHFGGLKAQLDVKKAGFRGILAKFVFLASATHPRPMIHGMETLA